MKGEKPIYNKWAFISKMEVKRRFANVIYIVMFLVGIGIFLYPKISHYINKIRQENLITQYYEEVENIINYEDEWERAILYNRELAKSQKTLSLTDFSQKQNLNYHELLNVSGSGVMGVIEIPKIHIKLPIYHGTDEQVLKNGVGHLQGTSLQTGGKGTHCVLSGHRGLPSAELFTHLDKLLLGDEFSLHILNHVMTYQVDQILTVEPMNIESLYIDMEKDYVTLVTCTPYGINSHRLLIRGIRID